MTTGTPTYIIPSHTGKTFALKPLLLTRLQDEELKASAGNTEFSNDPESAHLLSELKEANGQRLLQAMKEGFTNGEISPEAYLIPLAELLKPRVLLIDSFLQ